MANFSRKNSSARQSEKRSQLFIRTHNETLPVTTVFHQMPFPHGRIRCFRRNLVEQRLRRAQRCGEVAALGSRANS
jgi:hypothetical protein